MLLLVAFVSASVIALAARAALAARRDAIEIVHGLGATDRMIASRFAGRVTLLAFVGAALGVALTVPVLLALARLTAGFQPQPPASAFQASVPAGVWATLPALPVLAALIGWLTTQLTVRRWLWRLP